MDLASASVTALAPSRAAQYVRMSTEHQQYSPENQLEIIRQYAAAHNMEIVSRWGITGSLLGAFHIGQRHILASMQPTIA